jgi:transposase
MIGQRAVLGVDVSKEKSTLACIDSQNKVILEPFSMNHTHQDMNSTLRRIQELSKKLGDKPVVVMESTGHYYRIVFYLFYNAGFPVVVINPLKTEALGRIRSVRKVKTDKVDAISIALSYRLGEAILSRVPDELRVNLRALCRDYWNLKSDCGRYQRRLTSLRDQLFLLYERAFKNPFTSTALGLFCEYPTPEDIISERVDILIGKIKRWGRKGTKWAENLAEKLREFALSSPTVSFGITSSKIRVRVYVSTILSLSSQADSLLREIERLIEGDREYRLLLSIPGLGPISAATIISEIGDFRWFSNPSSLVAFAGIDTAVFETGKFKGTEQRMSKRGSRYLRRVLYLCTVGAIRRSVNGKVRNPILRGYYEKKLSEGKKKKVAIGACMRKMVGYIFATLRDNREFQIISPTEHNEHYREGLPIAA